VALPLVVMSKSLSLEKTKTQNKLEKLLQTLSPPLLVERSESSQSCRSHQLADGFACLLADGRVLGEQ